MAVSFRLRDPNRPKVITRTNVLVLMGLAYGSMLVIFWRLVSGDPGLTVQDAWDVIEAPIMALIGGTLAISKDLVADDTRSKDKKAGNNQLGNKGHDDVVGGEKDKKSDKQMHDG